MKLSVLDLVPVIEGGTAQAMADAALLAKAAEEAGYNRYWVAEHHGMPGIAGAAVSVVLAHVGQHTRAIRLGAGGIMLPNHNPLVIAEQFGALDALYPGRIDLGLGRAPGADQRIVRALRKDVNRAAEDFPADVVELQAQFAGDPRLPLKATPGHGAAVDLWILGSSLFGAQLAAMLGLPYAFASHFAPDHLDAALNLYRERFQPSATLEAPMPWPRSTCSARRATRKRSSWRAARTSRSCACAAAIPGACRRRSPAIATPWPRHNAPRSTISARSARSAAPPPSAPAWKPLPIAPARTS
jgi:luciferase family oxidoreductase group 1